MTGSYKPSTPVVVLGEQLKAERTRPRPGRSHGYALGEIPKTIGSKRTIERLELGEQDRVDVNRVVRLCRFYETDPELTTRLEELAEATHADRWWDAYAAGMDGKFWLYLQREERASHINLHDSIFVPALLQHELYIDAIQQSTRYFIEGRRLDFEASKRLRLDRQQRWLESGRRLTAVIGEAALLLNMGDEAMAAQKKHLLELAKLPHVEILVTPLSAGRHDVVGIELSLLEFDGDNEKVVVVGGTGPRYVNPDSKAGRFFISCFDVARTMSPPIEEIVK